MAHLHVPGVDPQLKLIRGREPVEAVQVALDPPVDALQLKPPLDGAVEEVQVEVRPHHQLLYGGGRQVLHPYQPPLREPSGLLHQIPSVPGDEESPLHPPSSLGELHHDWAVDLFRRSIGPGPPYAPLVEEPVVVGGADPLLPAEEVPVSEDPDRERALYAVVAHVDREGPVGHEYGTGRVQLRHDFLIDHVRVVVQDHQAIDDRELPVCPLPPPLRHRDGPHALLLGAIQNVERRVARQDGNSNWCAHAADRSPFMVKFCCGARLKFQRP